MQKTPPQPPAPPPAEIKRVSSAELMDGKREVEISHGGKVYRLRVTQLNKLILTA
ncbi:MAG: hemin uptake protein HemP [Burkholderiaceae bacterium]|nr:hemin uptake protein HemP [Burkholderiaceae bacterium]